MIGGPTRSTRTDTLFPDTTLFPICTCAGERGRGRATGAGAAAREPRRRRRSCDRHSRAGRLAGDTVATHVDVVYRFERLALGEANAIVHPAARDWIDERL